MKENGTVIENIRITFARRLRLLRKLKMLSQTELAKRSGFSQSTISAIETFDGNGIEFSLEKAELISRALGYELWQLILPISDNLDAHLNS